MFKEGDSRTNRKYMAASHSFLAKFYGKMSIGFGLNAEKRFFL